ncbi:MAG: DNRLRE domain-containing protein [Solirubrobacteraceae bacterium]|nr:DNRLRE domain-containing protein [Solirubrobacteraceae bacterium]
MLFDRSRVRALLCALGIGVIYAAVPCGAAGAEVVDRGEFSTTVDAGGGKLKTSVSQVPLNFLDGSGTWRAIDTELEPTASGDLEAKALDGSVTIPSSLSEPVELEHDGRAISLRLVGANAGAQADADGAEASFDGVLSGVDASYVARPAGVKETLKLATRWSPQVFRYDLRAYAAWTAMVEGGDVVLRDLSGDERYRITAPLAWDSASDPAFTNDLSLSVSKVSSGRWQVTLRPDVAWLSDPSRVYPVMVDPDVSWIDPDTTRFRGAAADCQIAGGTQANTKSCAWTTMFTGYSSRPYRALFRFAVGSVIPADANVSAATFSAYPRATYARPSADFQLFTLTSDWDNNATWNNRKSGTPWATAGGDYSTDSGLTSAPTAVSDGGRWYSWQVPLAAVRGWVDGTTPNYGFLLKANATSLYDWVSSEDDEPTEWPTLDITWNATSTGDTTAPSAPSDIELLAFDETDGTAGFNFTPGVDTGYNSSGVDHSQYRVKRAGEATFSAWSDVDGTDGLIDNLTDGQGLELELRSVDVAGNLSAATSESFTATVGSGAEAFDDGAREWLSDEYSMTAAVAQDWIEVQARAGDLDEDVQSSSATLSYAGMWFDNDEQKVHVKLLDTSQTSTVEDLAAANDLSSSVIIDITTISEAELNYASSQAQDDLEIPLSEGWVDIGYSAAESKVTFEIATDAPTAVRSEVTSYAAAMSVPNSVSDADGPRGEFEPQALNVNACGPTEDDESWDQAQVGGRQVGCGPPFRGGIHLDASGGEPCTVGFAVRSMSDNLPYLMTAGHCYDEGDVGGPRYYEAILKGGSSTIVGRLHSRHFEGFSKGEDAAIVTVDPDYEDRLRHPKDLNKAARSLRPWAVYQQAGDTLAETGEMNPQFRIEGVGTSREGQTLCISGQTSGSHCGTVTALGKAHGTAGYIKFCSALHGGRPSEGGDSGGPYFSRTSRGGALGVGMHSAVNSQLFGLLKCKSQYSSLTADAEKMRVWVVSTANTTKTGAYQLCLPPYFRAGVNGVCAEIW